jgi:hypothetical protein
MKGTGEAYRAYTKAALARLRSRGTRGASDWNWPDLAARIEHLTPIVAVPRRTSGRAHFRARRHSCERSRSLQSHSLLYPYPLSERALTVRGARITTLASMNAISIHSANAWFRYQVSAEFACRINSKIHIGPAGTRAGAISGFIRRSCFSLSRLPQTTLDTTRNRCRSLDGLQRLESRP